MSMSDFPKPRFDPTINLGHLISLGGILFALTGSWWLMDHRIASLERQIDKLAVIVVDSAILRQQVQDHGRRIDRLETPAK